MERGGLTDRDLERLNRQLRERRALIQGDVEALEGEALGRSLQEASGNLSNMPSHLADISSDSYEQDFNLIMLENEEEELRLIDLALSKLVGGTYGQCEDCEQPIPKRRLQVRPHAKLCVACQEVRENASRL